MEEMILQIIVWTSFFLLLVMGTRYYFKKNSTYNLGQSENKHLDERILIILPFRNEELTIERALQKVISEIISNVNCKLVLVDSASDDKSVDIVQKTIAQSSLTADMWVLIHEDVPGKGIALNGAIISNYDEGDIVVMVDADIEMPNGTLQTFRELMSNSKVGAISAQEYIPPNHPMANYKKRSNKLRIFESSSGNCPILEGSLLAWSPSRIGWNAFDELSNADDAQIGFKTIRSGHRSLVTDKLQFHSLRDPKKAAFLRSVRRSQGLNKQLLRNMDLLWKTDSRLFRNIMVFNVLLHIIIPWCVLSLILAFPYFLNHPHLFSNPSNLVSSFPSFLIVLSFLTNSGRTLLLGSLASVIAQFRALLRIRSGHWEPGEG